MARPRVRLPAGARQYVLDCAAGGALQPTKIAKGLGMTYQVWRRILRDNKDAQDLWTEAKAVERDAIVQKMYDLALEGDVQAARFMLASRHGLTEKGESAGADGRSSVVINLPSSMNTRQYERMVSVENAEAIGHDGGD